MGWVEIIYKKIDIIWGLEMAYLGLNRYVCMGWIEMGVAWIYMFH